MYLIWYLWGFSPQPEDKDTFFLQFLRQDRRYRKDTENILSYLILSYLILSYLSGKIGRTGRNGKFSAEKDKLNKGKGRNGHFTFKQNKTQR